MKPFLQNDDDLLWIALMMRETGIAASGLLQITDEVLAFTFNAACTLRLLRFDNEREKSRFEILSAMLGGEPARTTDIEEE